MFRKLMAFLGIIIVLALAALFIVWLKLPYFTSNLLSKKFGVEVSINDIALSTDKINLEKLNIANPQGFVLPKAFTAETIDVNASLKNYLDHNITIDMVTINTIYLALEFLSSSGNDGNWSTIMNNLQPKKKETATEKNPRSVLIKKLIMTDISIDLLYGKDISNLRKIKTIPRLEFDNVSSETGLPIDQISAIIFRQMLLEIFQLEGIQNMLQNILPAPLQEAIKPFKGFFNTQKKEDFHPLKWA